MKGTHIKFLSLLSVIIFTQVLYPMPVGQMAEHTQDILVCQYGDETAKNIRSLLPQLPHDATLGDVWSDLTDEKINELGMIGIKQPREFEVVSEQKDDVVPGNPGLLMGLQIFSFALLMLITVMPYQS